MTYPAGLSRRRRRGGADRDAAANNLETEAGDNFLLENGDYLLLEA